MLRELVICTLLLLGGAQARSSGADSAACGSSNLNPSGHGAAGQTGPSPYTIEVNNDQYAANGVLTVTLKGTDSFMGFLIVALPADDNTASPVGTFEANDLADSNLVQDICGSASNMGATHTSAFSSSQPPSNEIVLKWNAPAVASNSIIFYVTFVKSISTFWVKQSSEAIWNGVGDRPTTTEASAVTDPTPIAAVSEDGCGVTKSCYNDCVDGKCGFLLSWVKKSATETEFEIFASLTNDQNYVALGLSPVDRMSDVSIIACTAAPDRTSKVEQFYASGQVTPETLSSGPVDGNPAVASVSTSGSIKTMSCRFTYDNTRAKSNLAKWKDLDQPMFAFIARGPYLPGSLSQHQRIPQISPSQQDFLSDTNTLIGGTRIATLIKAHACVMILAWVFCASIGLILARYYKPMWVDNKACGQKVWFSYHRALMLCAMFLTIIGFVLILVQKSGIYSVAGLKLPTKAHPILGLIAIICSLLNPLIAAFRCHPGDSKRPIFNWVHWFFGTVAHVFAIVAIFLGMLFDSVAVPGWIVYVMMAFCLFHVCVEFILEIHQCCMYDKNRDRQEEYQMANKAGQGSEPKYAGRGFKCAMLVIYTLVVTLITIALVVIVAIWGSVEGTTS